MTDNENNLEGARVCLCPTVAFIWSNNSLKLATILSLVWPILLFIFFLESTCVPLSDSRILGVWLIQVEVNYGLLSSQQG